MHTFHSRIYDTMGAIAAGENLSETIQETLDYLALNEFIEFSTGNAVITEKGLELLGRLEQFRHDDRSRFAQVTGIAVSAILSIMATVVSFVALRMGGLQ